MALIATGRPDPIVERMSDQDRNPILSAACKVRKGVVKAVKGVGQQLAAPFLEVYGSQVCLQCHTPVHPDFEFCSDACCLDYWREFKAQCYKQAGHTVCGYPGCSKPCFVDKHSRRVHDYCSRTHANEHKALQDQSQKFGNNHHGNRHHGGNQSGHRLRWFQDKGPIKFYNRDDPYYEFTNFYKASIKMNGKEWPTSEHYFQAQKFVGTPYVEQIRCLSRPREAFDFTRDPNVSRWRRSDWEDIKEHVMYCALLAKFTQHDELRKLLLGTGERKLIEHSPYDSYWGDGGDGTGKNRLGKLLENIRHDLQCGQKGKKASSFPILNQCETVKEHPQSCSSYTPGGHEKDNKDTPPAAADPPRGPLNKNSSHSDSDDNMDCDNHTSLPNQQQGELSPSLLHCSQTPSSTQSMGAVHPPPGFPLHSTTQPQDQLQGSPGPHQMLQPPGPHQMPQQPPGPHQMPQPPGPHQMPQQPPGPHQMPPLSVYPPIGTPTYPQWNMQQQLPQQSAYPPNGASMQQQFNPQWPDPQQHSSNNAWNSQAPAVQQQPKPAYYDETHLTPTTTNQRGSSARNDVES